MDKLLNTLATCEYLAISRSTLYKLIRTGQLKAHYIAKAWKFRQTDLDNFLDRTAVGR